MGALHASVLMLSKHFSNKGVQQMDGCSLHNLIVGLCMCLYLVCSGPGIAPLPGNIVHC